MQLLVPDVTCGSLHQGANAGVLVDGEDVYRAVYDACRQAKRSIFIAGWQFDNSVRLLRGEEALGAAHPTEFLPFLRDLCERNPALEIYLLPWDSSAVFAFERVPLQSVMMRMRGHPRIHFHNDTAHPVGASQHQKLVVVDRSIALLGGMDICNSRWDRRAHLLDDPDRRNRRRRCTSYAPYHDINAYVKGDAVDVLRTWFLQRWHRATGTWIPHLDAPCEAVTITPSFTVDAPLVGLSRTIPELEVPPVAPKRELYALHLRAFEAAQRVIYIENQYLSSDEIGRALEARMTSDGPKLQIVFVLPQKSSGFKERISIGVHQARILRRLGEVAQRCGHQLGVYYSAVGDVPVFIHSKVLIVDDRFLLVSSANLSNRSIGFDSELGIAWESPEPSDSIRAARANLMAEHCGLIGAAAEELLGPIADLVPRLEELARKKTHRLRLHARNADEEPGWLMSKLVSKNSALDPNDPQSFHESLPEPVALLDRFVREPIELVVKKLRSIRR